MTINLFLFIQTLPYEEVKGLEWKSDYGFSLSYGRTYYLHKYLLFNMLKFGLALSILLLAVLSLIRLSH